MAQVQAQTFSLDGLGVYSICARFLYSGKTGSEVVCDTLEQSWMLSLWECAIQCKSIRPSHDIRGAMSAIATTNATARRRAIDLAPAEVTSYLLDLGVVQRTYWGDIKVALVDHLPNIGIPREDGRTIITKTMAISHSMRLACAITDDIVRKAIVSGSAIMELTHNATQTPHPHVAGRPVDGADDTALNTESELAPWFTALNRIKYYQDKRMTLDEFLGDFGFTGSTTMLHVRENEVGLPHHFDDESYSRISGSELLVFESARWISFKFCRSVLNFQKTNRAVSYSTGTGIHSPAVQTAELPASHERALSVPQIKEALKRLVSHREEEIERLYQLTLVKDDDDDEQQEDIKKDIIIAVYLKQVGDRMGITYCEANKRGSTARSGPRISCVTFNAHVLEDDIEFDRPRRDQVESLGSDMDYTEFQTASELDAWLDDIMKSRGMLGDQKPLKDMLRAKVEKLIATKFRTVHVTGPNCCWVRLYRLSSTYDEKDAEYFADMPHMITTKTTLDADESGMTQRGLVAVRTTARTWHFKARSSQPGVAVRGRIDLKEGDYLA